MLCSFSYSSGPWWPLCQVSAVTLSEPEQGLPAIFSSPLGHGAQCCQEDAKTLDLCCFPSLDPILLHAFFLFIMPGGRITHLLV